MKVFRYGNGPFHQAPFPAGPLVEVLSGDGAGEQQLGCARVQIPPGGTMPEHDHGESEALIVLIDGDLVITTGDDELKLDLGVVIHIAHGERVRVQNVGDRTAAMLAVFTPASFVDRLAAWPAV